MGERPGFHNRIPPFFIIGHICSSKLDTDYKANLPMKFWFFISSILVVTQPLN